MLPNRNINYCSLATCFLAWMTLSAAASQRLTDDRVQLPDAAGVVEAYMTAREWVDRFHLPPLHAPSSRLTIDNATGVSVALRSAGRIVGTGTAVYGAGMEQDLLLRRAVGRALSEVLSDPALAEMPDDRRDAIGRTLTLELEVAGPLQPLLGREFHQIAQQIEPGLEGVAMRRGDAQAMLFPSQLRATNTAGNVHGRLQALAAELGLAPAELSVLRSRHNVMLHRFRTAHVAQESPSRFPFETYRGDRLVEMSEVTTTAIGSFADGIAAHLSGKLWSNLDLAEGVTPPMGVMGDYNPITDMYRPIVATPLDQALTALALMRYAHTPHVNAQTAETAREAVNVIVRGLIHEQHGAMDWRDDPATCAVLVMLLAQFPDLAERDEEIQREQRGSARTAYAAFDSESGYALEGRAIAPHTQAMLAAAYSYRLTQDGVTLKPADKEYVRAAIDAAWSSVPVSQHVALLPWIGWAEIEYAKAARQPIHNAELLRNIRVMVEAGREMGRTDGSLDLRGGFILAMAPATQSQPDSPAPTRPTLHTARPAAFFATMLRHIELTCEAERNEAWERHRETMRFLIQLAVRDSSAWSFRNPAAALGGVRSSAWDASMPTAAQAVALLTAVETLHTPLETLRKASEVRFLEQSLPDE